MARARGQINYNGLLPDEELERYAALQGIVVEPEDWSVELAIKQMATFRQLMRARRGERQEGYFTVARNWPMMEGEFAQAEEFWYQVWANIIEGLKGYHFSIYEMEYILPSEEDRVSTSASSYKPPKTWVERSVPTVARLFGWYDQQLKNATHYRLRHLNFWRAVCVTGTLKQAMESNPPRLVFSSDDPVVNVQTGEKLPFRDASLGQLHQVGLGQILSVTLLDYKEED